MSEIPPPDETYTVETTVGKFRVEHTTSKHPYSGAYQYNNLRVGGTKYCVILKYNRNLPTTAELQWLITGEGGCELTGKQMRGEHTKHLLHLAITLLKTYTPGIEVISLLDNSKIHCKLPDGTSVQMFLNKYYFILYGQSWYEFMFSAVPLNSDERTMYANKQLNYSNPTYKPPEFKFSNTDLQSLLEPLFSSATSWADFGKGISTHFKPSCAYVAPWYLEAVAHIMDKRSFPEYWCIYTHGVPTVSYTRITVGGRRVRKTRKQRRFININDIEGALISPDELYNIKYT
jgi:hypothetical protein